jgi:hypothetical protein
MIANDEMNRHVGESQSLLIGSDRFRFESAQVNLRGVVLYGMVAGGAFAACENALCAVVYLSVSLKNGRSSFRADWYVPTCPHLRVLIHLGRYLHRIRKLAWGVGGDGATAAAATDYVRRVSHDKNRLCHGDRNAGETQSPPSDHEIYAGVRLRGARAGCVHRQK